jgi:hypothetical protein
MPMRIFTSGSPSSLNSALSGFSAAWQSSAALHRQPRMVRRRHRDAEERHDAVADVLVDERLVVAKLLRDPVQVPVDEREQHLRVHLLGDRRERLHVREEERPHHLPRPREELGVLHQDLHQRRLVFFSSSRCSLRLERCVTSSL